MKYYIIIKSKRFHDWYIYYLDYDNMRQRFVYSCTGENSFSDTEFKPDQIFSNTKNIFDVDVLTESEVQEILFMEKL